MTKHIKHHLTDDLISGYSCGSLTEAVSLAVATHVSMCDDCRAALESYDALGGGILETVDIDTTQDVSFAATMAKIKALPDAPRTKPVATNVPAPLVDYIGTRLENVKWRPIGMGVKQAILPTSKGAIARLLYIPSGTAVPDHGHNGLELTLVLQGAFRDESDEFKAGDIEVANEDMNHTPVAFGDQDCICLAVTEAPLRFSRMLHRVVQPFLKI